MYQTLEANQGELDSKSKKGVQKNQVLFLLHFCLIHVFLPQRRHLTN